MKGKMTCLVAFIFGVAAGGYASWKYAKKKYEAIAQEEIDSVKEAFSKKEIVADYISHGKTEVLNDMADIIAAKKVKSEEPTLSDYTDVINQHNYADKPYVITPEEFGEMEDYESISLLYFADGVLTDDDYELVDDVEGTIGSESLNHFGEYEDDSVFVRNDARRCDYEILKDLRNYDEVMSKHPLRYREMRGD